MTTPLRKPLRREVLVGDQPYTVTLTPRGMQITRKGRRKGVVLDWQTLVSGDAAIAFALNAGVGAGEPRPLRVRGRLAN